MNRPSLQTMLTREIARNGKRRYQVIGEAVHRYGYQQNEVAKYLGLYYSTVSRLLKDQEISRVTT
jgi:DNA-binding transcriptional regulator LsrR (DeoR family)